MKTRGRYETEFEKLFDNALIFTKRHFRKRLLPLTDAEDVAIEAAEAVLRANEGKTFRVARDRRHRWEMQKNMVEELVRNAARARRTQKAMLSLGAFDTHLRETQLYDEDGADVEVEEAALALKERIESDGGEGGVRIRQYESEGRDPQWLVYFRFADNQLRHAKDGADADARETLKLLRFRLSLSKRRPRRMDPARRRAAFELLRIRFRLALGWYHRHLAKRLGRCH